MLKMLKMWSLCVLLGLLGGANSMVNLTVTNELFKYLFRNPASVSLSTFPYCYDRGGESIHVLAEGCEKHDDKDNSSCVPAGGGRHSALDVYFDLSINQILEVNERQRSMRLKVTTYLIWVDCRLEWSLEKFPVHELHISIEQFRALGIYVPILMLNEEITPEASKATEKWISISYQGLIYLERMYTTEISCAFDISMYPFDTQACNMTFESVLEKPIVSLVNIEEPANSSLIAADRVPSYLSLYHLGMGRFITSDTWEIVVNVGNYQTRNVCALLDIVVHPDKCLYDLIVHKIILRRHPTYQLLNLLLPAFLIVTISSCVFLLPPGTSDKTNLSITILLSLFIFMQIMYYKMPETGETLPLLTQYYIFCVGLIVLSCIAGTFSVTLDSAALPIPKRVKDIVHRLGSRLAPDRISSNCNARRTSYSHIVRGPMDDNSTSVPCQNGAAFKLNKRTECKYEWRHVATIFDRSIFIIHIVCSVSVLVGYLVWGYISYTNYGFLLTDDGWTYRDIQMKMIGDDDGI